MDLVVSKKKTYPLSFVRQLNRCNFASEVNLSLREYLLP